MKLTIAEGKDTTKIAAAARGSARDRIKRYPTKLMTVLIIAKKFEMISIGR